MFWLTFVVIGISKVPDPVWVLLGLAAAFGVYGLVRGAGHDREGLPRQAAAMVVVGAAAAVTLVVASSGDKSTVSAGGDLGGYLVAAGLIGHAAWDAYHHRTGKVVARSMTEFCFVLDTLAAVGMIVVIVSGV